MERAPKPQKQETVPAQDEQKKGELLTQETGETAVFIDTEDRVRYIDVENG